MIEISNKDFLSAIFGSQDYVQCYVTSFDEEPKNLSVKKHNYVWKGGWFDENKKMKMNQYFTISLFDGKGRRKELFTSLHCIIIDDVKERIPEENLLALPEPSWILETSKGSEQWGYILSKPCPNISQATNLISGLIKNICPDGKDTGMASVTRYARLPEGYNTKQSKLINNKPFKCQLLSWKPTNKYELKDLAEPFGIDLFVSNYFTPLKDHAQPDHPVFSIPDIIRIKNKAKDNWFNIVCPWVANHTDNDDSGTAINITEDGSLRFKCHHGHCEKYTYKDLIQHISEQNPDWLPLYDTYIRQRKDLLQGRKEIFYDKSNVTEVCKKISDLFSADKSRCLFRHNGRLVKIGSRPPTTVQAYKNLLEKNLDYPDMPVILDLQKDHVREEIEAIAVCRTKTKEAVKTIAWPQNVLSGTLALSNYSEQNLIDLVEHPYVDENFKPVTTAGYDNETGLFRCFNEKLTNHFSQDFNGAKEAIKYLAYEVFDEFPFKNPIDRYATVSCLLSGMQRKLLYNGCPGYLFSAPDASSGKTTLAQVISHALYRHPAAATTYADNDTEMSKHLLSTLREGHSAILFDNVPKGSYIESNEIAKAITSQTYTGRLLSLNSTLTTSTTVLFMFTGNNVKVVGDFNTRILIINIDPNTDSPDKRIFKRPELGQWVLSNRDKILSACLTILSQGDGYDPKRKTPSRFNEWNKFIWYPIFKLTGIDITTKFQENKEDDPNMDVNKTFFETWYELFGDKELQASKLIEYRTMRENKIPKEYDKEDFLSFQAALKNMFAGLENINVNTIGKCLSKEDNRCYGEYKFKGPKNDRGKVKKKNGSRVWQVIKIS